MKKNEESKQVARIVEDKSEMTEYARQSASVESMIMQAIKEKIPAETMERFLAMRKELKAEYAQERFNQAMANFQSECPVIQKTKRVYEKNQENIPVENRKIRYSYAPIDSIVDQVKEYISKNGLSYTIRTTNDGKELTATCRVTHLAGHSEESSFIVPIGTEQFMSDAQKYGARSTFAKRYAFCDAFGIMTGDEDKDDGGKVGAVDNDEITKAKAALEKCMTIEQFKKAWSTFSKEIKGNKDVVVFGNDIISNIRSAEKNGNI